MFSTSLALRTLTRVARTGASQAAKSPLVFAGMSSAPAAAPCTLPSRAFSSKGGAAGGKPGGAGAKKPAAAAAEVDIESDGEWEEGDSEGEVMELTEALAAEITVEAAEEVIDPEFLDIKGQIEEHFTIHDDAGTGVVTLRSIPGKNSVLKGESLEISFDCQDEAEQGMDDMSQLEQLQSGLGDAAGEEEEPSISFGINFAATITKSSGDKLVFDCVASEQLQIDAVQYVAAANSKAGDTAADVDGALYGGPAFDHLDETLQNAFLDYLEDRHVDDDLSFFVLAYARHKEQKEYVHWLHKVLEFADPTTK